MISSRIQALAVVAGLAAATSCVAAEKGEFGTAGEAKAMVENAVAKLQQNESAALIDFNNPGGMFRDRDLYVFCFNTVTAKFTAHINSALIGTDVRLLYKPDGTSLGSKVFDAAVMAKEGQIVTVTYDFPRPGTNNPAAKESYVARVGSTACGVGYYK